MRNICTLSIDRNGLSVVLVAMSEIMLLSTEHKAHMQIQKSTISLFAELMPVGTEPEAASKDEVYLHVNP